MTQAECKCAGMPHPHGCPVEVVAVLVLCYKSTMLIFSIVNLYLRAATGQAVDLPLTPVTTFVSLPAFWPSLQVLIFLLDPGVMLPMCHVPIQAQCFAFLVLLQTSHTFASSLILYQASMHKLSPWLPLGSSFHHLAVIQPGYHLLPLPASGAASLNLSEP